MIRPAIEADAPTLLAAYEWLLAPPGGTPPTWDPDAATARIHALLANDRATAFVSDDGAGGLNGFVTVFLDILSVRYGQRAWVEDLAVAPDVRSGGIGAALLDAAVAWAREHGATHLELDSSFTRTDAHRFYERRDPSWDARSFGWLL